MNRGSGFGEITVPQRSHDRRALPGNLAPRGVNRFQASIYVGVSVTKFDQMVVQGRMPQPKRIDGRKVWDREALDLAFSELPEDGPSTDVNPWDVSA